MKRFYPWIIAFAAMLMLMVSNGLTLTGITAFDKSLLEEFGWSRGALKFRDLLTLMITGLAAPFIGVLIDRLGVRPLIIVGSLLLAAAYFAYGQIQSIGHVYLIHVAFAFVLVACGLNVAVILVSQWFVRHRGTAIGIALVGTSLGGMIFPPWIVSLTAEHGWRSAFVTLSIVPLVILLIGLFVARRPEQMGTIALGADKPPKQGGNVPNPLTDLSYAEAIRTPTFWALAFTAMMTFYAMLSASAHLFLHMSDMGFEPMVAGRALGVMFGMALIGKFAFGVLGPSAAEGGVPRQHCRHVCRLAVSRLAQPRRHMVRHRTVWLGLGRPLYLAPAAGHQQLWADLRRHDPRHHHRPRRHRRRPRHLAYRGDVRPFRQLPDCLRADRRAAGHSVFRFYQDSQGNQAHGGCRVRRGNLAFVGLCQRPCDVPLSVHGSAVSRFAFRVPRLVVLHG